MFLSLLVVLAFAFSLLILVSIAVRKLRASKQEPPANFDFTLAELQALRNQGHLTDDEFDRARQAVLLRAATSGYNPDIPVNDPTQRGFEVLPPAPPPTLLPKKPDEEPDETT